MAWEQRGAHTYYYRSVRDESRVRKVYLGTGPLATVCAAVDVKRRTEEQHQAEAWRQERTTLAALEQQCAAWWELSTVLLQATLYTAGYSQHDRGPCCDEFWETFLRPKESIIGR